MCNNKFIEICKDEVAKRENVDREFVFIVWVCKTLQNNKALVSATKPGSAYYEFTHDGDKSTIYIDTYRKSNNETLPI